MNEFSLRLKELRYYKGLSLSALSKATNIESSSLCRWENGQADVKGYQLVILARFFEVSIDYLMGLEH